MKGFKLSEVTWDFAKDFINENAIVVLPIGGGTKEHGPHLPCGTDFFVIDEIANRIVERFDVILLPTLAYAYYPAFVDFPGSVSIESNNFINFVKDILKSFIKFKVKKFLILDGGVSTHCPLKILSQDMHNEYGVFIAVTDILGIGKEALIRVCENKKGGHGDEAETSCMLSINPSLVHMDKAVEEYSVEIVGAVQNGIKKVFVGGKMETENGINGNAKLANVEKGKKIMDAKIDDIIYFLERF